MREARDALGSEAASRGAGDVGIGLSAVFGWFSDLVTAGENQDPDNSRTRERAHGTLLVFGLRQHTHRRRGAPTF